MKRLQNCVALISGGAQGQGAAEARLFVKEGAKVLISDILDEKGKALANELGENAEYFHLDVTKEGDWRDAIKYVQDRFSKLNILINNAGILGSGLIVETTLTEYQHIVDVNQTGCFLGMKIGGAAIIDAGGGAIVNISSVAGLRGISNAVAYTASKYAITGMTKTAALEMGRHGVRVNSIHPGLINTEMTKGPGFSSSNGSGQTSEQPIPRAGEPEEVARLALFLCSSESSYCTGGEYLVDGGYTAGVIFD